MSVPVIPDGRVTMTELRKLSTRGTSEPDFRRVGLDGRWPSAAFVDKICTGAKPGELPVEQPARYELIINVKTAKTLGLTIPPPLLLRGSGDRIVGGYGS